jgi:hypothetical protein
MCLSTGRGGEDVVISNRRGARGEVQEPSVEDEGGARGERDVQQPQRCRSRWQARLSFFLKKL